MEQVKEQTEEQTKKELLVIYPGKDAGEGGFYLLVARTGEGLASHFCSDGGFAPGDLYFNRQERITAWKERFGEVEVKFLEETDISVEELLKRNKEYSPEVKV